MPAFVQEYKINNQVITSVVMDEDEFLALCDELVDVIDLGIGGRAGADHIAQIKAAKHLPAMGRGAKTEKFFTRYGITSKLASFIVRGQGRNVAKRHLGG